MYQLRQVYYHERDNVCAIDQSDFVKITFIFNHQEEVSQFINAGIVCKFSFESQFWSVTNMGIFELRIEQPIYFDVKMLRVNPYGIKRQIYSNTTLTTKRVHYKGNDYNCELIGDSLIQHYNKKNEPITSQFNIECEQNYKI